MFVYEEIYDKKIFGNPYGRTITDKNSFGK